MSNSLKKHKVIILAVDDKVANLRLIEYCLQDHDFELITAMNGEDGLKKASKNRPDLVLLDVMMPGIDGFETCRRLKQNPATASIPVIFLTILDNIEEKVKGFQAGGIDYIAKPVKKAELLARVATHINQYLSHRRLEQHLHTYEQRFGPLAPEDADEASPEEKRLNHVRDLLLHNLKKPPSLVELAHAAGTNQLDLSKGFQEAFGMSVFVFLREQRFQLACRLLQTGKLTIGQIAHETGFRNPGDFSTAFKKRFGVTPRDYRRIKEN